MTRLLVVLALLVIPASARAADTDAAHAAAQLFERKVRPVLVEQCQKCHGQEKQKGGLRVDSRQALLAGGESGPAVVPGDLEKSLLVKAVCWTDKELQMPPAKKLPDAVIADLKGWVKGGAIWPGDEGGTKAATPKGPRVITAEDRNYWAYRAVNPPVVPAGKNPIDFLIESKLAEKNIPKNAPATPRELVRRAYFDLLGLPPTPEEVDAFEKDKSPDAFAKLIDHLLASPRFGERWGRHWLDVARFAQTNGYEFDQEKPYAWRYRDYVIRSFNQDKPYDRFILEQLAGDELPDVTDDSLIATGFYRVGVWDGEPDDARAAEYDNLDDVVVTAGAAFMGTTFGCARCHDHKLDPLLHTDYYRLLAFIRNVRTYNGGPITSDSSAFLPLGDRAAAAERLASTKAKVKPLREQLSKAKDAKERRRLETEIDKTERDGTAGIEWALAVRDGAAKPTNVLLRGNPSTPGEEVKPGFPVVFGGKSPAISTPTDGELSGRRLTLAKWVASAENPLTARVMANRIWQHLFGRGIVKTTADFGKGGTPPTHPELLDWLAANFARNGWSVKHQIRTVMLSQAYQMSSRATDPAATAADPANDRFWRQNLRRLEAEAIRDSVLTVSGTLNPATGGRGFFPRLAGEVLAGGSRPGDGWGKSDGPETDRRSVYAYVKRSVLPPMFEGFDYGNVNSPLTERQVTTVAPQALMLLNDNVMREKAAAFAGRVQKEASTDVAAQIERAHLLALGRKPTPQEATVARGYLDKQTAAYGALADRLTFAPDVPISLHVSYLNRLRPSETLLGPKTGWEYHRGSWSGGYEGILTVDRARTPFALWAGPAFADGTVETKVTVSNAMEVFGVFLRGSVDSDTARGYEIAIDARDHVVTLVRHEKKPVTLARVPFHPRANEPFPLKIAADGPRIRAWFGSGSEPLIDVTDTEPVTAAGRLGVRAWGAAASLDGLSVTTAGKTQIVATTPVRAGAGDGLPAGWTAGGGTWAVGDGAILAEAAPGSKAIWDAGPTVADGVIEADIMLRADNGDAGLLVRASDVRDGHDSLNAYNINIRPNFLRLGRHENNWKSLKEVPYAFQVGRWHHLKVEMTAGRVRIFVDGSSEAAIDYTDETPLPSGKIGLRSMASQFSARNVIATAGKARSVADMRPASLPPTLASAADKALADLCLVILNLNEFVYID
ncbi:DUF1553 domain-containing protein [Fimbriiglobus ruber]|uniref:Cytochrome c domain-containing protein n=1 Tax=Fimbriiglobus ruber TaxID=1908690 RepID=A0A225E9N5_9BACT|nr:DUF1553 domain-containing protein [Fimbriiglobus ruber]OWK46756.1 hypothetical protein FRUB_00455 [Fimbriiglobus ruber]